MPSIDSPRSTRRLFKSGRTALLLMAAVGLLPGAPAQAAFPGANGKIAFISNRDGNYEIYVMNSNGTGQTRITNNAASDLEPNWSADGTRITFASNRDGNYEIYVMNADGTGQARVTNNAAGDFNPAWSPDGSRIAFDSNRDGNAEIYVVNADGSNPTRLTTNAASDSSPAWSRHGSWLTFWSNRAGIDEIFLVNANGSNAINLTNNVVTDRQPDWAPDDNRIAFWSTRDGNDEIYVMNADGSNQTRLTNDAGFDEGPAWSPDGTRIAFQAFRDGNFEIYAMSPNGTGQTRLTNNTAEDSEPDWQPIPSAVPVTVQVNGFEGTSLQDNLGLASAGTPPNATGAAGTDQYMEMNVGTVAVYNKTTGALLAPRMTTAAFWTAAGAPSGRPLGNQRLLFDHYSNRWLAISNGVQASDLYLAVSDTSDALGSWRFTRIIGVAGSGAGTVADFPSLGMDDVAVYVSSNNFNSAGLIGTSLFSIPRADLFGGAPSTANMTRFDTEPAAPGFGLALQGAVNWAGNPAATARILTASGAGNGHYFHQLYGVNAAGATRTASTLIGGAAYDAPLNARQPDGTRLVDTLDGRIANAVYEANGKLYTVRTIRPAGADYDAVRWSVLDAPTGALIEEGDIAEGGFDYFQASIAANEFGEVVIGYNRSGGADKGLAGRISFLARTFKTDATGGLDQVGSEMVLRVSDVSDYRCGSHGSIALCQTKWGFTSAMTVDPQDHHRFHALGEYAASWSNSPDTAIWHTYVATIALVTDTDGDGIAEAADNCSLVANPGQCDSDGDGYGNRCDGDLNNNGFTNAQDTTLFRQQLGQASVAPTYNKADLNCNGAVNAQDTTLFRPLLGSPPGPSGLHP